MGNFDVDIRNQLNELRTSIKSEKNSSYPKSKELAKRLYDKICSNRTNSNYQQLSNLDELIRLSIIIKNYPKRIIVKGTGKQNGINFDASIMCLLNSNIIKFHDVTVKPKMYIPNSSESNIDTTITLPKIIETRSNPNYWDLKNMRYRKTNSARSSKRSTCYKSMIIFEFNAKYNLENHSNFTSDSISTELLSETVVVIVHSSQEIDSLLTLFWDDYYRQDRSPNSDLFDFQCHETSSFFALVNNLSTYFFQETGRYLTENNKIHLTKMMCSLIPSERSLVTFEDFVKQKMSNSNLSFGQWIISIIRMLKIPPLDKMWQSNFIDGFISKNADNRPMQTGSFILRFSERQAAIGVLFKTLEDKLDPWTPYTDTHLRADNLANLLHEYEYCLAYITDTNGNTYPIHDVLKDFMKDEIIDQGYTIRGSHLPLECVDQELVMDTDNDEISEVSDFDLNQLYVNCQELILEIDENEQEH